MRGDRRVSRAAAGMGWGGVRGGMVTLAPMAAMVLLSVSNRHGHGSEIL